MMTFNAQNRMHIAQQFRREKLRISGSQCSSSPQRDDKSNHTSRSRSSMGLLPIQPEPKRIKTCNAYDLSSGFETINTGSMILNGMNNVCKRYNAEVTSAASFQFSDYPESVYGSHSAHPPEVSSQTNTLSIPSNWVLGLHGQIPSQSTGSMLVSAETPEIQHSINNDHQSQDNTTAVEGFVAGSNRKVNCSGERVKDFGMNPFLGCSAIQPEASNQNFHGYHDSLQGNVLLMAPSLGSVMATHQTVGCQQIPLADIQFPAHAFTQMQLPHQAAMEVMPDPEQNFLPAVLQSHSGNKNNPYWQHGGELLFVPMSGCVETRQQLTAELSEGLDFDKRRSIPGCEMMHSLADKTFSMGRMGQSLHVDQSQDPNSSLFQELSLSLSSQQPSAMDLNTYQVQLANPELANSVSIFSHNVEDAKSKLSNGFSNRLIGVNPPNNSKDIFLASDMENQDSKILVDSERFIHNTGLSMRSSNLRMLANSKYLKVAQHLLDEVCSVVVPKRKGEKISEIAANKPDEETVLKESPQESNKAENSASDCAEKDVVNQGGLATASTPRCAANATSLTEEDRQNLQTRKTKLLSILDEVDRQYQQYYDHMQAVIFSFDSAIGQIGAAQPYTQMALKAMSRHFRSLRDTISSQIKATCKALGEYACETAPFKKVTSRLKFVDQQLRQQRSLQQLGMQQQPSWRPQRGLPEHSVSMLRSWLFEHFLHPYPKDADKMMLARQTGLSRSQVSNWFINARVRLWKPMIEEMYGEENKAVGQKNPDEVNQIGDQGTNTEQKLLENKNRITMDRNGMIEDDVKYSQQDLEDDGKRPAEVLGNAGTLDTEIVESNDALQRTTQTDCTSSGQPALLGRNSGLYDGSIDKDKDILSRQNVYSTHSTGLLNSCMFEKTMDFRSKESVLDTLYGDDSKSGSSKRYGNYPLAMQSGTILHHINTSGTYTIGGHDINGYSQMDVAPSVFSGKAVSLTLGLQHVDPLSQGNPHSYIHSAQSMAESTRAHDFSLNVISCTGNLDHNHEGLNFQSRKHVANPLLQEFVA